MSGATLLQAPGSGTSATTNVKTLVTSSAGATLTTASTTLPTSPTLWNVQLQLLQAYKGAMYPTTVYGTNRNPITNYATGQTSQSAALTVSGYLIVSVNQSNIQLSIDQTYATANPGVSLIPIGSGAALTAATREWLIGPLPGCTPAPGGTSSTSKYPCENVGVDIDETGSRGSHHADVVFSFVDMQQAAYIQQYATRSSSDILPRSRSELWSPNGLRWLDPARCDGWNCELWQPQPTSRIHGLDHQRLLDWR